MLLTVYIDGDWDTSLERTKDVIIYDKGTVYLVDESKYESFLDDLEEEGFDCYLCLEKYTNPQWSGVFEFSK